MGVIYKKFASKNYIHEAHVEQNFILPLLTEFLGYTNNNIFPKKSYKVLKSYEDIDGFKDKKFQLNSVVYVPLHTISGKPDYIIVDDDNYEKFFQKDNDDKGLFLIEVKNPKITLEEHTGQKNAYCFATRTNLIVMTNGTKFYVYDSNELLIECNNIKELDQKFHLIKILNFG